MGALDEAVGVEEQGAAGGQVVLVVGPVQAGIDAEHGSVVFPVGEVADPAGGADQQRRRVAGAGQAQSPQRRRVLLERGHDQGGHRVTVQALQCQVELADDLARRSGLVGGDRAQHAAELVHGDSGTDVVAHDVAGHGVRRAARENDHVLPVPADAWDIERQGRRGGERRRGITSGQHTERAAAIAEPGGDVVRAYAPVLGARWGRRLEQTGEGLDGTTAQAVRRHLLRPRRGPRRRRLGRPTQVIRQLADYLKVRVASKVRAFCRC